MTRLYEDLTSRLGEPLWYDDQAVPRYDPFTPDQCGIYDDWVMLQVVSCQSCDREFECATSSSRLALRVKTWDVADAMRNLYGWGDAPWHTIDGSQCAGTTMTSDVGSVLELWHLGHGERLKWGRVEIPKRFVGYVIHSEATIARHPELRPDLPEGS